MGLGRKGGEGKQKKRPSESGKEGRMEKEGEEERGHQ